MHALSTPATHGTAGPSTAATEPRERRQRNLRGYARGRGRGAHLDGVGGDPERSWRRRGDGRRRGRRRPAAGLDGAVLIRSTSSKSARGIRRRRVSDARSQTHGLQFEQAAANWTWTRRRPSGTGERRETPGGGGARTRREKRNPRAPGRP